MTRVARGTLLTFDPSAWTAQVLVDGADVEAQLPVSQWLPPAILVANAEVAVILFDPTNPDDGMLLAVYGPAGVWILPALNIGSPTDAPAGNLKIGGGSAATYEAITLLPSTHATSENVYIMLGEWLIAQDYASNGTKDFALYHGGLRLQVNDAAVNISTAVMQLAGTQVITARRTGWTAPSATLSRTAIKDTDNLATTIAHLAALVTDLTTHGLIGP